MSNELNKPTAIIGKKQWIAIVIIVILALITGALIMRPGSSKQESGGHAEAESHTDGEHHDKKASDTHSDAAAHGDNEHHGEAEAKGANDGQLFTDGDFGLEAKMSEEGGTPHLRLWLSDKGKPAAVSAANVSAILTRPDGKKETIAFAVDNASLKSVQAVEEPHVFEVVITAQTPLKTYSFPFHQEEGKVALSDPQIAASGITVDSAGPAHIKTSLQLPAEIKFNEDRTAHMVPRLAGVVDNVLANLGQQVKKGQVLAVLSSPALSEQRSELQTAQRRLDLAKTTYEREKKLWEDKISPQQDYLQAQQVMREAQIAVANASQKLLALGATQSSSSLGRYELRAPFDGMVVEKHISLGESVKEDVNVFTISDLSTVWAEISVAANNLHLVRVGEQVTVRSTAFDDTATGKISYVGSLIGAQTRTATARVAVANPKMVWRPGLFVNVELVSSEAELPVTVSVDAVQTVDEKPVIFTKVNGGFLPQQVQLGRSDGKRIEIVKGLVLGTRYAAAGSFVVKSQQGKSSASHTH